MYDLFISSLERIELINRTIEENNLLVIHINKLIDQALAWPEELNEKKRLFDKIEKLKVKRTFSFRVAWPEGEAFSRICWLKFMVDCGFVHDEILEKALKSTWELSKYYNKVFTVSGNNPIKNYCFVAEENNYNILRDYDIAPSEKLAMFHKLNLTEEELKWLTSKGHDALRQ
jgi:hypothetical protein